MLQDHFSYIKRLPSSIGLIDLFIHYLTRFLEIEMTKMMVAILLYLTKECTEYSFVLTHQYRNCDST